MSTVNTIRLGIHTAIAGLTGLTTIQQYDALRVEDAFYVAKRKPAIVVVWLGRRKGNGPVGQRTKLNLRYRWALVVVTENWRDGVAALSEATNGAEAISDALDALRGVEITAAVGDDPIYLQFVDDSVSAPPDRPVDGGPATYIINWETTEVLA